MELTEQQKKWASKRRQGASATTLRKLLITQKGRCALSGVEMIFENVEGTPVSGGKGCHPLYPAVDHIDPGNPEGGHQIVCYALNDLKGHLPPDCFKALSGTNAWQGLMEQWRKQAQKDKTDREAFMHLLRPNAKPKKRRTLH
jgi:predicted nucleotidyltransferase